LTKKVLKKRYLKKLQYPLAFLLKNNQRDPNPWNHANLEKKALKERGLMMKKKIKTRMKKRMMKIKT
jgi:hypothetical protein